MSQQSPTHAIGQADGGSLGSFALIQFEGKLVKRAEAKIPSMQYPK